MRRLAVAIAVEAAEHAGLHHLAEAAAARTLATGETGLDLGRVERPVAVLVDGGEALAGAGVELLLRQAAHAAEAAALAHVAAVMALREATASAAVHAAAEAAHVVHHVTALAHAGLAMADRGDCGSRTCDHQHTRDDPNLLARHVTNVLFLAAAALTIGGRFTSSSAVQSHERRGRGFPSRGAQTRRSSG